MNENATDQAGSPRNEPRVASAQGARRSDTRRQLILAAERLFAERGIDGVSLREINLAANQRNTSAAHYHFGSKEALIDAIFEFRRAEIGRRRDALLDVMEATGRVDARMVAQVLIEPVAKSMLEGPEGGRYYVEFLAQLLVTSPQMASEVLSKHHQSAGTRLHDIAVKGLPHVPPLVLLSRSRQMARHSVFSVAGFLRGTATVPAEFGAFVNDLIDATAGYLAAPQSEQTLAMYAEANGPTD